MTRREAILLKTALDYKTRYPSFTITESEALAAQKQTAIELLDFAGKNNWYYHESGRWFNDERYQAKTSESLFEMFNNQP